MKSLSSLIYFIICFSLSSNSLAQTEASQPPNWVDGSGGKIYTLAELRWLSEKIEAWDEDWELMADIDASETKNWNIEDDDTLGFNPIGNNEHRFTGLFEGNGNSIKNIYIKRPDELNVGFFGSIESAEIYNLALFDVLISGGGIVGGLASTAEHSTILSCGVTGSLYSGAFVSGFCDLLRYTYIWDSYFIGDVSANAEANGFIGVCSESVIGRDYSISSIKSAEKQSGFAQLIDVRCRIYYSYNYSEFLDSENVGLFAYYVRDTTVYESYYYKPPGTEYDSFYETNVNLEIEGLSQEDFGDASRFANWDFESRWEIGIINEIDSVPRPYFKRQFTRDVYFKANSNGTIVGNPYQQIKHYHSSKEVEALPDEGYDFAFWGSVEGDSLWAGNAIKIDSVVNDTTLVAYFRIQGEDEEEDELVVTKTSIPGNNDLLIFPNPITKGMAFIRCSYCTEIQLYDNKGVLISETFFNKHIDSKAIDVSDLSNGIYFVNIHTNGVVERKKILVVN